MIDWDMNKNNIFLQKLPTPKNIWHRLFGSKNKDMALAEIYNLLSRSEVLEVKYQDIYNISSKHHVKLHKDMTAEISKIYREFLQFCLEDSYLSDHEIKELQHLKKILSLNDQEVGKAIMKLPGRYIKWKLIRPLKMVAYRKMKKNFCTNYKMI
ncbi:MAG: hypothetical protein ACOCXH_02740 [Cyclobacteriaceae bacterium]